MRAGGKGRRARVPSEERIGEVRRFNRFYTRRLALLEEGLLGSPFSLAEARVLYELAHGKRPTAVDLAAPLGLDRGYLSRILARFRRQGYVARHPSPSDRRRELLRLTARGRRAFAPLDAGARKQIRELLAPLAAADEERLGA